MDFQSIWKKVWHVWEYYFIVQTAENKLYYYDFWNEEYHLMGSFT